MGRHSRATCRGRVLIPGPPAGRGRGDPGPLARFTVPPSFGYNFRMTAHHPSVKRRPAFLVTVLVAALVPILVSMACWVQLWPTQRTSAVIYDGRVSLTLWGEAQLKHPDYVQQRAAPCFLWRGMSSLLPKYDHVPSQGEYGAITSIEIPIALPCLATAFVAVYYCGRAAANRSTTLRVCARCGYELLNSSAPSGQATRMSPAGSVCPECGMRAQSPQD